MRLDHGFGKHRSYRLGQTFEPGDHREEDVLGGAVAQFGQHPQPELRALGLLDPNSQDFLVPRAANSNHQVHRPVVDHPFVADFDPDALRLK
jgi:hypothetical protein